MKSVDKHSDQLSGHIRLIAVPQSNISSISGPTIMLKDPTLLYELHCARESLKVSIPNDYSKAGNFYKPVIEGFVPGRSAENDLILDQMIRFRHVVVLQNSDGNFTRIGETNHALKFNFDYSTSPDPVGQNGYSISFTGNILFSQKPFIMPFLQV